MEEPAGREVFFGALWMPFPALRAKSTSSQCFFSNDDDSHSASSSASAAGTFANALSALSPSLFPSFLSLYPLGAETAFSQGEKN